MLTHFYTFPFILNTDIQVKIDEAQLKEQEALRKQLQQEQDLLQTFQEAQDQKLKVQHERERTALDEKVELSKKELEKEVQYIHVFPYPLETTSASRLSISNLYVL